MQLADWIVVLAALAGITWVNWYFFAAQPAPVQARAESAGAADAQSATITVRGGYAPSTIRVRAGTPVRLTFDRQEDASCSEEVVFPAFGVRRYLPAYAQTTIVVTPPSPGTYEFTCGMSMLHGRLVAE